MVKLSILLFLTLLVAFCAAMPTKNREFGIKKEGRPIKDVETTWKKFMFRLTKDFRASNKATKRELNLANEPSAAVNEKKDEKVEDIIKDNNGTRIDIQSCTSSFGNGCSITAFETNTQHISSTGVTNTSSSNSNNNSSNSSNSNSSSGGGTSSSNSSNNSSSSSSSSG